MKDEKLFVITPIFNPRDYKSRIRLYHEFEDYMAFSGAQLITVEVVYGDRAFQVTGPENKYHLQLRSPYEMWHKERMINLGIQHLLKIEPDAKKVCWIDADVRFSNPHWVRDTLTALDHYDVVQLFSQHINLGPQHELNPKVNIGASVFYNYVNKLAQNQKLGSFKPYVSFGHPGLAWGATIAALDKLGGLLDICIHGSGDSHMANALMGDVRSYYNARPATDAFYRWLDNWQERADLHIKHNVGYVAGLVFHYWHGKMGERQYENKWDIICNHQFDPYVDIVPATNGLYQYAGNKKAFENDLRTAAINRNEDSVDL